MLFLVFSPVLLACHTLACERPHFAFLACNLREAPFFLTSEKICFCREPFDMAESTCDTLTSRSSDESESEVSLFIALPKKFFLSFCFFFFFKKAYI